MTLEPLTVVGLVLAVLLALGWYLSYTAVRLDRLHTRLEATGAALDAQVVRRAQLVIEVAYTGGLDPASGALLVDAARDSLEHEGLWRSQRCDVESALTELMRVAVPRPEPELEAVAMRVRLARSFHNEAVAQTRQVRQRPAVRLFRLAGHTDLPEPVSFDDGWPPPS